MTVLELADWDAVWQRFYDRGVQLGMTPNASVWRAYDEMAARYAPRPKQDARVRAARSD